MDGGREGECACAPARCVHMCVRACLHLRDSARARVRVAHGTCPCDTPPHFFSPFFPPRRTLSLPATVPALPHSNGTTALSRAPIISAGSRKDSAAGWHGVGDRAVEAETHPRQSAGPQPQPQAPPQAPPPRSGALCRPRWAPHPPARPRRCPPTKSRPPKSGRRRRCRRRRAFQE